MPLRGGRKFGKRSNRSCLAVRSALETVDTDAQSTSLFFHLHLDYALFRYLVPFFEVGGFHYLDGVTAAGA